jgi:G3E family GTPase
MHIVPTTVFSGFLGSGKTTIISHLIADLQSSGIQVVYIKNEIGDENVDGQIMRGQNIATKELLNGCICCTLVGPFIQAIDEIIEKFKPDRLIIEASGAADPSAIALMIQSHPKLERDGIISIIDVANFEGYKDLSQTAQNQTKFTDLLVFNKVELVDLDRTRAVVGYVRELNTHSPIVEAPQGKLNPEVAFGLSTNQLADLLISAEGVAHREHHEQHSHLQEDGITTFHIPTPGTCTLPDLEKFLTGLPGAIYRVKGFVQLSDGTTVVANKVGNRISFVPAPESTKITEGALVFIGFSIAELEGKIATQLASVFKK